MGRSRLGFEKKKKSLMPVSEAKRGLNDGYGGASHNTFR
jgi:hypothetical protein